MTEQNSLIYISIINMDRNQSMLMITKLQMKNIIGDVSNH